MKTTNLEDLINNFKTTNVLEDKIRLYSLITDCIKNIEKEYISN